MAENVIDLERIDDVLLFASEIATVIVNTTLTSYCMKNSTSSWKHFRNQTQEAVVVVLSLQV